MKGDDQPPSDEPTPRQLTRDELHAVMCNFGDLASRRFGEKLTRQDPQRLEYLTLLAAEFQVSLEREVQQEDQDERVLAEALAIEGDPEDKETSERGKDSDNDASPLSPPPGENGNDAVLLFPLLRRETPSEGEGNRTGGGQGLGLKWPVWSFLVAACITLLLVPVYLLQGPRVTELPLNLDGVKAVIEPVGAALFVERPVVGIDWSSRTISMRTRDGTELRGQFREISSANDVHRLPFTASALDKQGVLLAVSGVVLVELKTSQSLPFRWSDVRDGSVRFDITRGHDSPVTIVLQVTPAK